MIDSIAFTAAGTGAAPDDTSQKPTADKDALRKVATEFEAVFLAEMLSHTSLGKTSETFGGGVGEDAFGSFLTREWANEMAGQGGIGLSEAIFQSLVAREGGDV